MILLIPLAMLLSTAGCYLGLYQKAGQALRRSVLTSAAGLFFFIAASTELLSAINAIHSRSITSIWVVLDLLLFFFYEKQKANTGILPARLLRLWWADIRSFFQKIGSLTTSLLLTLWLTTLTVALVAMPNNADSLSYHLGRLGYWIQNGNVGHYATNIERAITFSPFSEYIHLHTFLLAGSERYFQLVQWLSLGGIFMVISLLMNLLGGSRRPMVIALIFASTLPIVVLESMTTQNDLVAAFFVLATAFYVFDFVKMANKASLFLLALSVALGMLTKGTFVFFAFPFGIFLFVKMIARPGQWKMLALLAAGVAMLTLLLNAPFWYRTDAVFGSPIGNMSSGNRNEISAAAFLSSTSKHVFLHLGFVSPGNRYNAILEDGLKSFHQALDMPLDHPQSGMTFKMNKLNFNEDFAHNPIGMVLILVCIPWIWSVRAGPDFRIYALLVFASFLTFCLFISYQIYGSRLHVPFFLLAAPMVGMVYDRICSRFWGLILVLMLWLAALPFALLSVTHPLLSSRWFFEDVFPKINRVLRLNIDITNQLNLKQESIVFASREQMIWGDRWAEVGALRNYVDSLGAQHIGFDFEEYSYDYGYQYVLRKPGRTFTHVMVRNPSVALEPKNFKPDCIIAEHHEPDRILYHGRRYRKTWCGTYRWVFTPE